MARLSLALAFIASLAATSAGAGWGVQGNDTGGIISWTPEVETVYAETAAAHCFRYHKVAFITSIHRVYGDYVGFVCAFPRDYDPAKAWSGVVVTRY